MADYPHLGFDPAPGDLDALAAAISAADTVLRQVAPVEKVFRPAENAQWNGDASNAFGVAVHNLAGRVHSTMSRQAELKGALTAWRRALSEFQAQARNLEREAAHVAVVQEAAMRKQESGSDSGADATLARANSDLAGIRQRAHRLYEHHRNAARRIAGRI